MSKPTIVFPMTNNKIFFSELKEGETFQYGDSLYMKTYPVLGFSDEYYEPTVTVNCINISTGDLGYFKIDDFVQKVKAEIKISYE